LIDAATDERITVFWSPWVIGELYRTLTWDWIKHGRGSESECSASSKRMMRVMLLYFRTVDPEPPFDVAACPDPDDMPIWKAAVQLQAHYLVSNNTNDFPPRGASGRHTYQCVEWITAADLLFLLGY